MKPLTVFSAFDGVGIGLLALKRAGVPIAAYYASEVDKYAISVAKKNHPEIIHVGDVKQCYARNFPQIDLLIGGSPCQDLSIAKANREGLKGARSGLFWHFVRLLRTMKPRYFLLENVASMSKEDKAKITEIMGVEPILINSSLVSAQQRKRLYWTNIPGITQPQDKGISVKDVLESGVPMDLKSRAIISSAGRTTEREYFKKQQGTMVAEIVKSDNYLIKYRGGINNKLLNGKEKCSTLVSGMGADGGNIPIFAEPVRLGHFGSRDNQGYRIYSIFGKSVCLKRSPSNGISEFYKIDLPDGDYIIRKLTPVECERLQTWPDNYTKIGQSFPISSTQRYKIIGNGWTADVIAHIFKFMKFEEAQNGDN